MYCSGEPGENYVFYWLIWRIYSIISCVSKAKNQTHKEPMNNDRKNIVYQWGTSGRNFISAGEEIISIHLAPSALKNMCYMLFQ